ncbi:MAG TPA: universal stress protein [Gemmataceae bacterium]|nr:universal stress protein [Gemmataceae bacterium]
MFPIHTILHPTDFSERSANALQLACALACDYGARIVILHVVAPPAVIYGEGIVPPDPNESPAKAREQIERLEIPAASRAERRVEEGDPALKILDVAGEINADLIVMGTHGRTGLGRLLMGSVAEEVVRRAVCPVLTVTNPFAPVGLPGVGNEQIATVAG